MGATLTAEDRDFLERVRLGHLATADREGRPHVVPVCFAVLDERTLAFAVDDKPKAPGRPLKRLRNLAENDRFALVVDRWVEDWGRLAYLLLTGRGVPSSDTARCEAAVAALRARYPQYVAMGLDAARHTVVELRIQTVHRWAGGPHSEPPAGGLAAERRGGRSAAAARPRR